MTARDHAKAVISNTVRAQASSTISKSIGAWGNGSHFVSILDALTGPAFLLGDPSGGVVE